MTKVTNTYLSYLPAVLAVSLIPFALDIMQWLPGGVMDQPNGNATPPMLWKYGYTLGGSLPNILILWMLSRHFGRPQAGLWSALLVLLTLPFSVYAWGNTTPTSVSEFIAIRLVTGLPYFAWGILMLRDRRAGLFVPFLFLGLSMSLIGNGAGIFHSLRALSFEVMMSNGMTRHISPLASIATLLFPVLLLVVLAEVYQIAEAGWSSFRPRRLDLANQYGKWEALTLFYVFRLTILLSALGSAGAMEFLSPRFDAMRAQGPYFSLPYLYANLIFGYLFLVVVLYVYRKFLLEFFFQHGKVPSYFYWFIQAPLFDLLLFPIGLLVLRPTRPPVPNHTFEKSLDHQFSNADTIRSLLILGQIIVVLIGAVQFHQTSKPLVFGGVVLGTILSTWYFYDRRLIYGVFGLLFVGIWVFTVPGEQESIYYRGLTGLLANGVAQSVLRFAFFFGLAGVLHIGDFETGEQSETDTDEKMLESFVPEV